MDPIEIPAIIRTVSKDSSVRYTVSFEPNNSSTVGGAMNVLMAAENMVSLDITREYRITISEVVPTE